MTRETARAVLAEFLGAGALSVGVIGSGIAAERLTRDAGVALLINSVSTAAALFAIITILRPISGAHINPVVSIVDAIVGGTRWRTVVAYLPAQVLGFVLGALLTHVMFGLPLIELSDQGRLSLGTFTAEVVATAGLVVLLFVADHRSNALTGALVAAYIGSAYFFTSSTSFANPGITIGRMFTDTFSGIAPMSGLGFIGAQLVGAAVGLAVALTLRPQRKNS